MTTASTHDDQGGDIADVPAYRRIASQLRKHITDGTYPPGYQLPSEPMLGDQYGVGRVTVRRAISTLVNEGLLDIRRGFGTYVRRVEQMAYYPQRESRPHPADAPHDRFMAQITAEQRAPSQSITVEVAPAPPEVAARLGMAVGTEVVARLRVRSINGVPVNTNDSYFPLDIVGGSPIMDPADIPRGTNQMLADLGYAQVRAEDEITCRMPTPDERGRLGLGPGTPVMIHLVTGYAADNRPVRCAINVLPGDRHRVVYERRWE